ncbi:MAG TPA: tetratricopeptide repeat protein [Candidatus Binatia bacterium]|nr:tetratricopeptide repeat protein [Candidatus Binatia bacterium]
MRFFRTLLAVLALTATTTACASSIKGWIVATRVHQGDVAASSGSYKDAALAYQLALQISPQDAHARAGLIETQMQVAEGLYRTSKFDDALAALTSAAKYDPQNARVAELRSEVEQAKIKRLIVLSNYPTYKENALVLRTAYENLTLLNKRILTELTAFSYTYDTENLNRAIRDSYELEQEVARNRRRLVAYRELVESGVPANEASGSLAPPASVLPLP